MSDFERVKNAMHLVLKHKGNSHQISEKTLELMAETAVKTMWLIQNESNRPGVEK